MQMNKNTVLFVIIAALGGFIGGFFLANSINRSALSEIRPENQKPGNSSSNNKPATGNPELTSEEIKAKIAEADKNPGNFEFQKDLGTGLYQYAVINKDNSLLADSARILERARSLNPKDFDVLVALGNARFDIGFAENDLASFQTARDIYTKALEVKPGDANVMTDYGISYFVQEPPAYDKAAAALQKVLDADPKQPRALQFMIRTLSKQNRFDEAEKALAKLSAIDPANEAVAELRSQIAKDKGGLK